MITIQKNNFMLITFRMIKTLTANPADFNNLEDVMFKVIITVIIFGVNAS